MLNLLCVAELCYKARRETDDTIIALPMCYVGCCESKARYFGLIDLKCGLTRCMSLHCIEVAWQPSLDFAPQPLLPGITSPLTGLHTHPFLPPQQHAPLEHLGALESCQLDALPPLSRPKAGTPCLVKWGCRVREEGCGMGSDV